MIYVEQGDGVFYAEVEPAGSRWLPLNGRTSRWWFEVIERGVDGDIATTWAYQPGGSGGGFTFRKCVMRAEAALETFAAQERRLVASGAVSERPIQ